MSRKNRTWAGQILGTPGGSLRDAAWAANEQVAGIGRDGEVKTGEELRDMSSRYGWTVLHDLRIPIPGTRANIDHLVVAGKTVVIVDTKMWAAGRYWTIFGKTFRGTSRFPYADTRSFAMAHESIPRFLSQHGITARVSAPIAAIRTRKRNGVVKLGLLRLNDAKAIPAAKLEPVLRRRLPNKPANPSVVAALATLLNAPAPAIPATQATPHSPGHIDDSDPFAGPPTRRRKTALTAPPPPSFYRPAR